MRNRPNDLEDEIALTAIIEALGNETVLGVTRPVDILAMVETDTGSAPDTVDLFNGVYGGTAYTSVVSNFDVPGGDRTGFVYNTSTVSLLGTSELSESLGLEHNLLRGEFRPVGTSGEADFFMYAVHLKSGSTNALEDVRSDEADIIRADADSLGLTTPIIYGGDFNWNDVDESNDPNNSAWDVFTSAGNGQAFDAFDVTNVAGAGQWRDNAAFKHLHTQNPGAALDDRFGAQMVTDEFFDGNGLELIQGSYRVFGNDGSHTLNAAITTGTGASMSVLEALSVFSDHLPVVADYRVIPEPVSLVLLAPLVPAWLARRRRAA